jgi:hypothetical protein
MEQRVGLVLDQLIRRQRGRPRFGGDRRERERRSGR